MPPQNLVLPLENLLDLTGLVLNLARHLFVLTFGLIVGTWLHRFSLYVTSFSEHHCRLRKHPEGQAIDGTELWPRIRESALAIAGKAVLSKRLPSDESERRCEALCKFLPPLVGTAYRHERLTVKTTDYLERLSDSVRVPTTFVER